VAAGGAYPLISRNVGAHFGQVIGIIFGAAQIVAIALNTGEHIIACETWPACVLNISLFLWDHNLIALLLQCMQWDSPSKL